MSFLWSDSKLIAGVGCFLLQVFGATPMKNLSCFLKECFVTKCIGVFAALIFTLFPLASHAQSTFVGGL